ncbi:MAG TPA: hypothetical protein VF916_09635 [Ktedonobacterales bacterium]
MRHEVLRVYLQEIQNQCTIAQQAVQDMSSLLGDAYTGTLFGGQSAQAVRFWYALQSFLTAVARISNLLWPGAGKRGEDKHTKAFRANRGHELCAILELDHRSVLYPRVLRDHVEHLDERLDRWAQEVEVTGDLALYVRMIQPGSATTIGLDPARCFLFFDANAHRVTFMGEEFELPPLGWAVQALGEQVKHILDTPPSAEEVSPPFAVRQRDTEQSSDARLHAEGDVTHDELAP